MNKFIHLCLLLAPSILFAHLPWTDKYQEFLIFKASQEMVSLSTYPSLQYPNTNIQDAIVKYPDDKVLVFGYGSLMNKTSAARSLNASALRTIKPSIAFGLKRLFNYKVSNPTSWGPTLDNEKAMLNIQSMTTYNHLINGVTFLVTFEDLKKLTKREVGYDLVPILVANWQSAVNEDPCINIQIAYTFMVPDEMRLGIDYTHTQYYPVRKYLQASQEGAAAFGPKFLNFWNKTTYLSDGTTLITDWDQRVFSGILNTKEP